MHKVMGEEWEWQPILMISLLNIVEDSHLGFSVPFLIYLTGSFSFLCWEVPPYGFPPCKQKGWETLHCSEIIQEFLLFLCCWQNFNADLHCKTALLLVHYSSLFMQTNTFPTAKTLFEQVNPICAANPYLWHVTPYFKNKTLPEAQRTQGIESITWIIFLTEISLK